MGLRNVSRNGMVRDGESGENEAQSVVGWSVLLERGTAVVGRWLSRGSGAVKNDKGKKKERQAQKQSEDFDTISPQPCVIRLFLPYVLFEFSTILFRVQSRRVFPSFWRLLFFETGGYPLISERWQVVTRCFFFSHTVPGWSSTVSAPPLTRRGGDRDPLPLNLCVRPSVTLPVG